MAKNEGLSYHRLKQAILSSLTPDLLEPEYRALLKAGDPPETGHCAIATEAFYYLAGGREAGFIPVVCGYAVDAEGMMHFGGDKKQDMRRETHWWVRGPLGGQRGKGDVFDVTVGQYPEPFPYEHGRNTGFMQPQKKPSRRAQIVMDRVQDRLGAVALEVFRQDNIKLFQELGGHYPKNQKTVLKAPSPRAFAA